MYYTSYAQCIPNPIYQDSLPNVWPITGFPSATVGASYYQKIDVKIPATLLDAALGDSSYVTIDTLGQIFYIGDWPVDSMILVGVYDLPPGILFDCYTNNCAAIGDSVTCANIHGIPTTVGSYATDILSNLYTHGVINVTLGGIPLTVPVEIDYYSQFGYYDTIYRYTIEVLPATSIEILNNNILSVSHFHANNKTIEIRINTNYNDDLSVYIHDILGRKLYNDILQTNVGENRYIIDRKLNEGIHIISLQQRNTQIFEKVFVSPSMY
jgi:hypothetical protein